MFKDNESVNFLQDPDVTNKLSNCKALSDVNPSDYDVLFYVGGKILRSPLDVMFVNGVVGVGYRARTSHRSLEGSQKCGDHYSGKVTLLYKCSPIVPGILIIERAILTVLEERLIGRCCMSWTRVSTSH